MGTSLRIRYPGKPVAIACELKQGPQESSDSYRSLTDCKIFDNFPGADPQFTQRRLIAFGSNQDRYLDASEPYRPYRPNITHSFYVVAFRVKQEGSVICFVIFTIARFTIICASSRNDLPPISWRSSERGDIFVRTRKSVRSKITNMPQIREVSEHALTR